MPSCQVSTANWDVANLEVLCTPYGIEWEFNRRIPLLINSIVIKMIFLIFSFGTQMTTYWLSKHFKDLWEIITLKVKHENLVIFAKIARI